MPAGKEEIGVPSSYLTRILPLSMGTFAVGTGLLVIQGILPEMARDLGVSVGAAGQLVTVFAVTYAASAPLLSTFGARFDRRRLLVAALLLFALSNLAAAPLEVGRRTLQRQSPRHPRPLVPAPPDRPPR